MGRGRTILNGFIESGVYFVVIASVLAFGTVEGWSLALMRFFCFGVFTLWFLGGLWADGGGVFPSVGKPPGGAFRFLGVTFRKTGLGIPIGLF
ncbi:MAG: hypothetical protein V3U66_03140, partial [Acidobacteriota bacterium]